MDLLVRGEDNTIACPVYYEGALVVPTLAGSVLTVTDDSGTAIVNAQAVTITDGVASYTIPEATLPSTTALAMGYAVRWSLQIEGKPYHFRNTACVVLSRLYSPVDQTDLTDIHSDLMAYLDAGSKRSFQPFLDDALMDAERRLLRGGRRPWLILDSWGLFDVIRTKTLERIFRSFQTSTSTDQKYGKLADQYAKEYEKAWQTLDLNLDYDQDDLPSPGDSDHQSGEPPVFLGRVANGWNL
jgi:hypothetical protein